LVCTTPISNSRTYCKSCFGSHRKGLNLNVTLEEAMYNKHHRSSAYALVRARARAVAAKLDWSCCINCGYNKHVEIAHRKAISSFPHETLVNDINSVDNLVPLCPNCHWEFDHNLLSLP
jgi:predicted restriction endonuclease